MSSPTDQPAKPLLIAKIPTIEYPTSKIWATAFNQGYDLKMSRELMNRVGSNSFRNHVFIFSNGKAI